MITQTFHDCAAEDRADVVIVGAGMAGLYCAWRLIQQDPTRTITLVERLDRTGGRLDTDIVRIKPGERVREEEGGMRFNYGMPELMRLICALDLCDQIVDFPMGSEGDTNRFQVRGHAFTVAEAEAGDNMIWSELYNLAPEEVGLSPTELVTNAYRNILYANGAAYESGRQPRFWQRLREEFTWKGKTLNNWQLWGLLRDMGYSEECITMLTETIGFAGPFKSLANAGDALQILADFPTDPVYYTFRDGFSTLPDALVDWLAKAAPHQVKILLSTNVDRIDRHGEGGYALRLNAAPEGHKQPGLPFVADAGEARTLTTDRLILAVAAQGLETLFIKSPALHAEPDSPQLWERLRSAMGMKLMKINLYFDAPWWLDGQTSRDPIQYGPNFSSLPINAVYPFYSLRRAGDDDPAPRADAAAALTIYCDFDNTNFWKGLQNIGPLFDSALQRREREAQPQVQFAASQAVVEEARTQLAALFGAPWVPEPILTSYRLWNGEDDFEYAYHQWRLGVKDREVIAYMAAPRETLHVCNEAYSDMQGWVNGSLRSADQTLATFGLDPMADPQCENPRDAQDGPTPNQARRRPGLWGG